MTAGEALVVDLLVIGTGPAASRCANKCAGAGWNVAIAEEREFGGTCALHGCNPKKVLVRAAELADWARRCDGKLVTTENVQIDWETLIRFKREFTDTIPKKSREGYEQKGIKTLHGQASFVSPTELRVGAATVRPRHILIATGARPAPLDFDGHEHVTTSDAFMQLTSLPPRILFIGGGYISMEFAHVAARAGASVKVIDHGARILKRFPATLVERLVERSGEVGIEILPRTELEAIRPVDGANQVHLNTQGSRSEVVTDLVVHGAGRVPNLEGLKLKAGEVAASPRGVEVNDYLQSTTNEAVYAAGDCAATGMAALTPNANQEGRTVAQNLLGEREHRPDYGSVPTAVFTVPSLASVGLGEDEAREQGKRFQIKEGDMSSWGSVRKVGEPCAAYQVLIEEGSDKILGAHLLGPQAAETINLFALAMKFDLTSRDLKSVLMTFPTFAADVRDMI